MAVTVSCNFLFVDSLITRGFKASQSSEGLKLLVCCLVLSNLFLRAWPFFYM